jgi:hypothetical protein
VIWALFVLLFEDGWSLLSVCWVGSCHLVGLMNEIRYLCNVFWFFGVTRFPWRNGLVVRVAWRLIWCSTFVLLLWFMYCRFVSGCCLGGSSGLVQSGLNMFDGLSLSWVVLVYGRGPLFILGAVGLDCMLFVQLNLLTISTYHPSPSCEVSCSKVFLVESGNDSSLQHNVQSWSWGWHVKS